MPGKCHVTSNVVGLLSLFGFGVGSNWFGLGLILAPISKTSPETCID